MLYRMSKTIHDAVYGEFLAWLKAERARRNAETGGKCTMRALVPRLARLLGRPNIKFSWVAKIEQKDRRIDCWSTRPTASPWGSIRTRGFAAWLNA